MMAASQFKSKNLSSEASVLSLELQVQPRRVTFATIHVGRDNEVKLFLRLDSRQIRSSASFSLSVPDLDFDVRRWKSKALRLPPQSCFNVKHLPSHSQGKLADLVAKLFQRHMKLRKTGFTTPVQKSILHLKLQRNDCLRTLLCTKSISSSLRKSLDCVISRKGCNVPKDSSVDVSIPHPQDHDFHTDEETSHTEQSLEQAQRDTQHTSSWTNGCEEVENRTPGVNQELACDHLLTRAPDEQVAMESRHEQSKNECPTPRNTTNTECEGPLPNNDEHLLNAEYVLAPFHIVVFRYPPQKFNSTMQVLFGLCKRCVPYDTILTVICGATEHQFLPLLHPPFLPELHSLLGMLSSTAALQRQACFTLLVEFGKGIETCLLEGVIPYTDARSVTIVPFVQEQKLYLQERTYSCFQLQLPRALSTDETAVFVLLVSKVLSESAVDSGLLKTLECGDQCFVFHGFASYLATKNHALEALVKVFPEHATAFVVLVSPSEKHTKDLVDSLLNDLPRRFQSKFFSRSYEMIEIFRQVSPAEVSLSQQLPAHMQALLTGSIAVDTSQPLHRNDSGFLSTPHSYAESITADVQEESGIGEHFV